MTAHGSRLAIGARGSRVRTASLEEARLTGRGDIPIPVDDRNAAAAEPARLIEVPLTAIVGVLDLDHLRAVGTEVAAAFGVGLALFREGEVVRGGQGAA